nr:uncharacterized protein LOC109409479 [Aedes albopictus]
MNTVLPFKVCDSSRQTRHVIFATGTINGLIEQATIKFQRPFQHIVLANDGCELSSDMALAAFSKDLLMMLESGETWIPEGFYATDTQAQDSAEGLQNTSAGQIVLSAIQDTPNSDDATSTVLQTLNIDPAVMAIFPNQRISVAEPLSMKLLAGGVSNQDESLQQPSTSRHVTESIKIQETAEIADHMTMMETDDPVDENQSPNTKTKRPRAIEIQKSSKKYASSDMKFRSFEVNYSKLSDNVLSKLDKLQEFKATNPNTAIPSDLRITKMDTTSLVNSIVDQLRTVDTDIKASTMEMVAKQLLRKFPCLEKVDDDGYRNGISHIALKHKMINHNAYLNRFRKSSEQQAPTASKGRNVRAGTLKCYWENWKKDCENETLAKLRRDEPTLLTEDFLKSSQAYVRHRLNDSKDLLQLMSEYPVLRRRGLLKYHFEQATGVSIDELRKYYDLKRAKIVNYSETAGRKFKKLNNDCTDLEVLRFLACLVGEKIDDLVTYREIGTRIDEVHLDSPGPLLVSVDMGQDTAMYYVYVDQVRLSEGTDDVICALQDLLCIHFVHNFKYIKPASKFLELMQQYLLKIIPSSGSKSNAYRVGNQQRVVQKVIDHLSSHEF